MEEKCEEGFKPLNSTQVDFSCSTLPSNRGSERQNPRSKTSQISGNVASSSSLEPEVTPTIGDTLQVDLKSVSNKKVAGGVAGKRNKISKAPGNRDGSCVRNASTEQSNPEQKCKNNPGLGTQFEINVPAYFALKLNNSKEVRDFSIESNAQGFGNLDDVIIDVILESNKHLKYAFQLKHRENEKCLSPEVLQDSSKTLNIKKYCADFKQLPEEKQKDYHYVLYTTQNFDHSLIAELTEFEMLDADEGHCPWKNIFDTSSNQHSIYKFKVNDNTQSQILRKSNKDIEITKLDYQNLFSKFTMYASQTKVDQFEGLISEILKDEMIVGNYLNLFRKWHQGLFTNQTIDRKTINAHLVDIYLSNVMILNYYFSNDETEGMYLFEKTTKNFDVTIIDEREKNCQGNLKKLKDVDIPPLKTVEQSNFESYKRKYKITESTSALTECMLHLAKDYKFIEASKLKLDENLRRKMFLFFFQFTLFVYFNKNSAKKIYELISIYRHKKDKIKFILLGHGVDVSQLSGVEVFFNLNDLSEKDEELYEEITSQCRISIQGRQSVTLKELIKDFNDIKFVIETKEIVRMLSDGYSVGENKLKLPPHYIRRKVSSTVFGLHTILNFTKDKKNILIINFNGRRGEVEEKIHNEGVSLVEITQYIGHRKSFIEESVAIYTEEQNPEKQFEIIRTEEAEKRIHLFKMIAENTFILIKSTSNLKCKHSHTETFPEEEIHSVFDGTLNLLVAEFGMGKLSLIKYLKNECPWNVWTIYVDLSKFSDSFSTVRSEEVVDDFLKEDTNETNFSKELKKVFKKKKKLVFFLDGLHKLKSKNFENVIETIDKLTCLGYRVWVSCQPNLEKNFSEKFHLFSLHILPFSKKDQEIYTENQLKSATNQKINVDHIKEVLDKIRTVNRKNVLGTPLQLNILIEIFSKNTESGVNIFALTKLYEHLFRGMLSRCFELGKFEGSEDLLDQIEEFAERYEIVALQSVLDDDSFRKLQIESRKCENLLNKINTGKECLGLVTKLESGKAGFEDPILAQYFACRWLKHNKSRITQLKDVLFSHKNEKLLFMFNMIMAEDNPLHLAIMYKNSEQFQKHVGDIESKDAVGRTAVHIACCSGPRYAGSEILEVLQHPALNLPAVEPDWYTKRIERFFVEKSRVRDTFFEFDCVEYAFASKCLYLIDFALKNNFIDLHNYYHSQVVDITSDPHLLEHCEKLGYTNLFNEIKNQIGMDKVKKCH